MDCEPIKSWSLPRAVYTDAAHEAFTRRATPDPARGEVPEEERRGEGERGPERDTDVGVYEVNSLVEEVPLWVDRRGLYREPYANSERRRDDDVDARRDETTRCRRHMHWDVVGFGHSRSPR